MKTIFEPVRESEGEGTWEVCAPGEAEAWRVTLVECCGDVRSWAYKDRARASVALASLAEGRPQPLNVTHGMARLSVRRVYLR